MQRFERYLAELMRDDDALFAFLHDPIKASKDAGITKAERAILRRVVAFPSTASSNGYSIIRPLLSYRGGIRMLQNMLHVAAGSQAASVLGSAKSGALADMEPAADASSSDYHTLYVYYSGVPDDPFGAHHYGEYAYRVAYYGYGQTIADVMDTAYDSYGNRLQYTDSAYFKDANNGERIVSSITIPDRYANSGTYTAPPPPDPNSLDPSASSGVPFWFYSVNGYATSGPHYAETGTFGESYATFELGANDVIYWQVFLPSTHYGYAPCPPVSAAEDEAFAAQYAG
jgi:hypothetical protein